MMNVFKSKKGFTLIELLIVMAIIAILIGISLPRFRGMQDEGQKSKVRSNLATLRTAVEAYAASPRSNGRTKYPDNSAVNAQAAWTAPYAIGTGWQATHLLESSTDARKTTGPPMLSAELTDPFSPAAGNQEYRYYVNATGYYVIWSLGTGRVNQVPTVTAAGAVTFPAGSTAIFVSNGNPQSN
ncbi:MAG: type II secretion system protein [bacterium]|jgi:general secretion pathway protein G|nr:type II secretion system protein [bacterium]